MKNRRAGNTQKQLWKNKKTKNKFREIALFELKTFYKFK